MYLCKSRAGRSIVRMITYKTEKELPCDELHHLFYRVGWSDKEISNEMLSYFNLPFINSTLVVSAWDEERLIGCVRALSDKIFRSIVYDFAVLPEYQHQGIGKELLRRLMEPYPDSEWLVETEIAAGFYQKQGFHMVDQEKNIFLVKPSKWF